MTTAQAPAFRIEDRPAASLHGAPKTSLAADCAALLIGLAMTLAVHGYQFGESNHTVYLLDPLRRAFPGLLERDWYTSQTLQYHAAFGLASSWLLRLGAIEPVFLAAYLLIAAALHVAWLAIVRSLGGSHWHYLLSAVFFHASAGGVGLGMYWFIQDSAVLPSNIAAVAMLCAIAVWLRHRYAWSGVLLALSGLLHLNFAVVALGLWTALSLWEITRPSASETGRPLWRQRSFLAGTLAVSLCLVNIALALRATVGRSGAMPLQQFVELYVRLRHPHHYDPQTWPAAIWISFLWPIPLAVAAFARATPLGSASARRQVVRMLVLFAALQAAALIGAGLVYMSETLVQLSLYRFSIYIKLLSCIGAALLVSDPSVLRRSATRWALAALPLGIAAAASLVVMRLAPTQVLPALRPAPLVFMVVLAAAAGCVSLLPQRRRWAAGHFAISAAIGATLFLGWGRWLGITHIVPNNAAYRALCDWAAANTPRDAVFLVPPDEMDFRLRARRAIVVNYKGVPQLSRELAEWQDRLQRVLDLRDLTGLPRPLPRTFAAIQARYDRLPAEHLVAVARQYDARYIVTRRRHEDLNGARLVYERAGWFMYDLRP